MDAGLHRDATDTVHSERLRRAVTAAVGLPSIAAALWLGDPAASLALAAGGGAVAFEQYRAVFGRVPREAWPGVAATAALPLLPAAMSGGIAAAAAAGFWLIAGAVAIACLFRSVARVAAGATEAVGHVLAGILFAGPGLFALAALRADPVDGRAWTLAILVVTASNAAGAHAAGLAFGRTPPMPSTRRGRSWEGVLGGAIASVIATAVVQAAWLPHISTAELAALAAGSAVIGPASAVAWFAIPGTRVAGRPATGHVLETIGALLWNSLLVAALRAFIT
jgi:CDP-diglyceride synthetase